MALETPETQLRIKDCNGRLQNGGEAGGGASRLEIGSKARHSMPRSRLHPAALQRAPEISPEPLRQIIVINNKLTSPPLLKHTHTHAPRGKTNVPRFCRPGDWTQTRPPSCWPSVSNFVCLFVYSKTPKIAAGGDCGDGGGGPRPVGVGVGGRARGGYLHRAPTVNWD